MILEHLRIKVYYYLQNINMQEILICYFCIILLLSIISEKSWKKLIYNCILSSWYTMLIAITILGRSQKVENNFITFLSSFNELVQGNTAILYDILFNIVLFIPFGILLQQRCQTYKNMFIIIFSTVFVESIQLYTSYGLFEISDLIANTIGGGCGIIFFNVLKSIRFNIKKVLNRN